VARERLIGHAQETETTERAQINLLLQNNLLAIFLFFSLLIIWMIFFSNLLIELDVPLLRKKHMGQKLCWETRRKS